MRGLHLFMIIVMIPAMIALGHDIYLFIENDTIDGAMRAVKAGEKPWTAYFATLGWIWTHYDPDSYRMVAESLDEQSWGIIDKILAYKAVIIGIVFGLILGGIAFLFKSLKLFGFSGGGHAVSGNKPPKGKMVYKRK